MSCGVYGFWETLGWTYYRKVNRKSALVSDFLLQPIYMCAQQPSPWVLDICQYSCLIIIILYKYTFASSISTCRQSLPVHTNSHDIMLPSPCFTGTVLITGITFMPKTYNQVSLDRKTFFQACCRILYL